MGAYRTCVFVDMVKDLGLATEFNGCDGQPGRLVDSKERIGEQMRRTETVATKRVP
jgi:hypothetical protein